ncbi:zinc-finger domain-containing protein [Alcaligenaceae bacterium CGII-47]|nr:zinc-finger domain-containing protein [Alcaligenaceae bacterium CGII-47]
MSSTPEKKAKTDVIYVGAEDLPLFCPGPKAPLWCMHPRIYIEVVKTGTAKCQYCSTLYQLREGEKIHAH